MLITDSKATKSKNTKLYMKEGHNESQWPSYTMKHKKRAAKEQRAKNMKSHKDMKPKHFIKSLCKM